MFQHEALYKVLERAGKSFSLCKCNRPLVALGLAAWDATCDCSAYRQEKRPTEFPISLRPWWRVFNLHAHRTTNVINYLQVRILIPFIEQSVVRFICDLHWKLSACWLLIASLKCLLERQQQQKRFTRLCADCLLFWSQKLFSSIKNIKWMQALETLMSMAIK